MRILWLHKASPQKGIKIEFAEIESQFLDWNDRETSNCARFLSNAKISENKMIFAASIRRRGREENKNFSSNIDNITDNEASLIH